MGRKELILADGRWSFGRFELDASRFQLREGTRPVKLERIPLELLLLLVERKGDLVTREEMAARLWGNGIHVDAESGVHTAIRKVRAALRDSAGQPVFVETVPSKGYRFISPVAEAATIAVLPFESLNTDTAESYFSEGLTEELITALGGLVPLNVRVIARNSSMAHAGLSKPMDQIGRELGATFLVHGTVRFSGQRLRVTAKLVRTVDQIQIWAEAYDSSPGTVMARQQEIGADIACRVGAAIRPRTAEPPSTSALDPDAQDLCLRGRYYWHRRSVDAMTKAEELFRAAIDKSPSFAPAHAGLADTYIVQILMKGARTQDLWERAQRAVETARRLDPNLGDAHTAQGIIDFFVTWNWASAERSFLRALDLNPNNAIARQFYAHLLSNSLRHEEAIAEIGLACAIDPLSPIVHSFAAMFLLAAGRDAEALDTVRHALTLDPDFFPAHAAVGHLHSLAGESELAVEAYRAAFRLSGGNVMQLAFQGAELARSGNRDQAHQVIATMSRVAESRFVPPSAFALVHTALSDHVAALSWLEKAIEVRDVFLIGLPCWWWWDPLRTDQGFSSLVRRCGFMEQPSL
jgi:TolB-like protein/tetratricopeptide (TPR) repeat protein